MTKQQKKAKREQEKWEKEIAAYAPPHPTYKIPPHITPPKLASKELVLYDALPDLPDDPFPLIPLPSIYADNNLFSPPLFHDSGIDLSVFHPSDDPVPVPENPILADLAPEPSDGAEVNKPEVEEDKNPPDEPIVIDISHQPLSEPAEIAAAHPRPAPSSFVIPKSVSDQAMQHIRNIVTGTVNKSIPTEKDKQKRPRKRKDAVDPNAPPKPKRPKMMPRKIQPASLSPISPTPSTPAPQTPSPLYTTPPSATSSPHIISPLTPLPTEILPKQEIPSPSFANSTPVEISPHPRPTPQSSPFTPSSPAHPTINQAEPTPNRPVKIETPTRDVATSKDHQTNSSDPFIVPTQPIKRRQPITPIQIDLTLEELTPPRPTQQNISPPLPTLPTQSTQIETDTARIGEQLKQETPATPPSVDLSSVKHEDHGLPPSTPSPSSLSTSDPFHISPEMRAQQKLAFSRLREQLRQPKSNTHQPILIDHHSPTTPQPSIHPSQPLPPTNPPPQTCIGT